MVRRIDVKEIDRFALSPDLRVVVPSDVDAYAFSGQERRSATRAEIKRGNPLHPLQWLTGMLGYAD